MKKWLLVLMLTVSSLAGYAAMAQDEGLYDPAPPEGSAFVRLVNLEIETRALEISKKKYKDIAPDEIGPYVPLETDNEREIRVGPYVTNKKLEPGAFYTVYVNDTTVVILKDVAVANPLKAVVSLYNLTNADPLSLKTVDGTIEVIPPVEAGAAGYREINEREVPLAAFNGETKALDLGSVFLKRGEIMSIFVSMTSKGPKSIMGSAKTDTTQ